jgi:hypothetical protein
MVRKPIKNIDMLRLTKRYAFIGFIGKKKTFMLQFFVSFYFINGLILCPLLGSIIIFVIPNSRI